MPDIGATVDNSLAALHGVQVTGSTAFAADVTRILTPSWQFVCHESDLPAPGTAMRFDFCSSSAKVNLSLPHRMATAACLSTVDAL